MDIRWHLKSLLAKTAISLLKLSGWYTGYWNHWRIMFSHAEERGLHIIPVHYYSPIPDTRDLPSSLWQKVRFPAAFDLKVAAALELLDTLREKYQSEYSALPVHRGHDRHTFFLENSAFLTGDAEFLYALLRDLKPRKIIEIGSGFSTLLICQAIRANSEEQPDYKCNFVAIEPYPPNELVPPPIEVTRIESRPLQEVGDEPFKTLRTNDILFIDSSHVVRAGGDVVKEYLEILPQLSPGVIVHIHDIFIPYDYPKLFIEQRLFWNEQYLLEAFLNFNSFFEVIMPLHAVAKLKPDAFRTFLPSFDSSQRPPSSFWLRRIPVRGVD